MEAIKKNRSTLKSGYEPNCSLQCPTSNAVGSFVESYRYNITFGTASLLLQASVALDLSILLIDRSSIHPADTMEQIMKGLGNDSLSQLKQRRR